MILQMGHVNGWMARKRPARRKLTRPREDSLVPHGEDSRLRRLPIAAASDKTPTVGYDAAILRKCKEKNQLLSAEADIFFLHLTSGTGLASSAEGVNFFSPPSTGQ